MAEYMDSYPEPEPSGVNKFLKGLGKDTRKYIQYINIHFSSANCLIFFLPGNKMKLLQIK